MDLKIRAANGNCKPLDLAEALEVLEDLYAVAKKYLWQWGYNMPAKRKRTQANIDGDRRYQQPVKRVIVTFKQDSELLAYLRSQVSTDAEIPALIKQIIEDRRNA